MAGWRGGRRKNGRKLCTIAGGAGGATGQVLAAKTPAVASIRRHKGSSCSSMNPPPGSNRYHIICAKPTTNGIETNENSTDVTIVSTAYT